MTDSLLTIAQAAKSLGLSRQRVHKLIRSGRLPATRMGAACWLVEAAALDQLTRLPGGRPKKKRDGEEHVKP